MTRLAAVAVASALALAGGCKKKDQAVVSGSGLEREIEMTARWAQMPEAKHRRAALVILEQLVTAPIDAATRARLITTLEEQLRRERESSVAEAALDALRVLDPGGFAGRVLELASGGPPAARRAAIGDLASVATREHGPRLAALLAASFTDPDLASSRGSIVAALEQAPHADAIEHLLLAVRLARTDWEREKAAKVLAACGASVDQMTATLELLVGDGSSYEGRVALLEALAAREGFSDPAVPLAHLDSGYESIRVAAIHALGRLRDPAAAEPLLRRYRASTSGSAERRALEPVLRRHPRIRWPTGPEAAGPTLTP